MALKDISTQTDTRWRSQDVGGTIAQVSRQSI